MADLDQDKMKVIFICYHNSARSQMAEGILREFYGDRYEAYSAGTVASQVDPRAIEVMNEFCIDISSQRSKTIDEYRDIVFDLAITVCDKAKEACPISGISLEAPATALSAKKTIHKAFKDPATAEGSEEEQLNLFRQVRDEIVNWIDQTFESEEEL